MSDQALGKKLVEEDAFDHFAAAYEDATGSGIEIVARHERPDFICRRADGTLFGLELTQVRRDPETRWAERVALQREWMSASDAKSSVYELVVEKNRKRQDSNWEFPNDTILVVQLLDCPLSEFGPAALDALCDDLAGLGLSEIWLADYTTLHVYREVELFCVKPREWRGHYDRAHPDRKPYG